MDALILSHGMRFGIIPDTNIISLRRFNRWLLPAPEIGWRSSGGRGHGQRRGRRPHRIPHQPPTVHQAAGETGEAASTGWRTPEGHEPIVVTGGHRGPCRSRQPARQVAGTSRRSGDQVVGRDDILAGMAACP